MTLQLINTLGTIADAIKSDNINEIVEWAKEVYRENYSFRWYDANYRAWNLGGLDIYKQDITCETFKHIV